jgi:hypothetical protein
MEKSYVTALKSAALQRRSALHLELAVGLSLYLDKGGTKRALTLVYAKAGYVCESPEDADYKTVNRRVNVSHWLFEHLSREKVAEWGAGAKPAARVKAICVKVAELGLDSIDAVKTFVGKSPEVTKEPAAPAGGHHRRMEDKPGIQYIRLEHIEVLVAQEATKDELLAAAAQLTELASRL